MKKVIFSIAAFAVCLGASAQSTYTPRDAQKSGQDFSKSSLGSFSNPKTLVEQGTSSDGVAGGEYSGTAPDNLTGQRSKGSLLTIGNESRAGSVSKVNSQGGYSNDRDKQSDEAVHFLNRQPVLKPTLSPNDPMLNSDTYSLGKPPFNSSLDKVCKQVIDEKADLKNIEACIQTYPPSIYECSVDATPSVAEVPGQSAGVLMNSLNGDMVISSQQQGNGSYNVVFGPPGDNYWGNGTYVRSLNFNLDGNIRVARFQLVNASFDDWVMIKVNGSVAYVGPYGGDRLNLVNRCESSGDGGEWCYEQVQYCASCYGNPELRTSWNRALNINVLPYLRNGSNRIETTTIVRGRGESFVTFNVLAYSCPANSVVDGSRCLVAVNGEKNNCTEVEQFRR